MSMENGESFFSVSSSITDINLESHRNSLYKQFKRHSFYITLAGLYPWKNVNKDRGESTGFKLGNLLSWIPAGALFVLMVAVAIDRILVIVNERVTLQNLAGLAAELRLAAMVCFRSSVAILIPLSCYKTRKLDKVIYAISTYCIDAFSKQPWNNRLMCVSSFLVALITVFMSYFVSSSLFELVDLINYPRSWYDAAYSVFLLAARTSAMHVRLVFFTMIIFLTSVTGLQFSSYFSSLKHALRNLDDPECETRKILADHFALSKIVEKADKILSPLLLVTVPLDLAITVFLFAHFFDGSNIADALGYNTIKPSLLTKLVCGFDLFWMLMFLFGPVISSAYLRQQAERVVKEMIYYTEKDDLESKFKTMLKKRAGVIKDFPPVLTIWNIANLDKNVFIVILGILGTYLFVVLEVSQWYEEVIDTACSCNCTQTMA